MRIQQHAAQLEATDGHVGSVDGLLIAAEALMLLGRDGIVPLLKALTRRPDSPALRRGAHHVLRLSTDENLRRETAPVLEALDGIERGLEIPIAAERALAALEGRRP